MEQEQADNGAIVKSKSTKPLRKVVYRWTFETASDLEYDKHSMVRYSRHKWNYPKLLLTECQYTHIHIVLNCMFNSHPCYTNLHSCFMRIGTIPREWWASWYRHRNVCCKGRPGKQQSSHLSYALWSLGVDSPHKGVVMPNMFHFNYVNMLFIHWCKGRGLTVSIWCHRHAMFSRFY